MPIFELFKLDEYDLYKENEQLRKENAELKAIVEKHAELIKKAEDKLKSLPIQMAGKGEFVVGRKFFKK